LDRFYFNTYEMGNILSLPPDEDILEESETNAELVKECKDLLSEHPDLEELYGDLVEISTPINTLLLIKNRLLMRIITRLSETCVEMARSLKEQRQS
jgi:hypothetical protein